MERNELTDLVDVNVLKGITKDFPVAKLFLTVLHSFADLDHTKSP
jgi:hypothetical protein